MGFIRRLFAGSQPSSPLYSFQVKCSRCGEIIDGHIDLQNDLSLEYENDREFFFVRKVLMGSNKCFQRIEVEFEFTPARVLIDRRISGGEFV